MKYLSTLATALAVSSLSGFSQAADGIEVSHLSPNNSMVRVSDDARFLLLPIEEGIDDAKIEVLLDGNIKKTLYARLARNKVDYFVPLDISQFKDQGNILLNIVAPHNRGSVRETSQDACWNEMKLSDSFDTTNTEKYRPAFHHTPLYGWMNDPNGMVYKDGVWHLYYQYNPYGSKWQNMTWGHSSSKDLINWEHHPLAIEPDGIGTIFSGSSVVDKSNTAGFGEDAIVSLYTSCGLNQMQSLAYSTDNGLTFTKFPGNPILTMDSEARDPNMFWNEETKEWNLYLAHALEHEMLFFTSPDLKTWTLQSAFGKGEGAQGGVWECPDLMQLPVNGTDEKKWVLICNLNPGGPFGGSATQYFVGDFDGKKFTADTDASGKVPTKWMDFGKDHYATVSWSNAPEDRNVVIGWMSNWQYAAEVPTRQFRSANTLPRDISLFKGDDGQYYLSTIPSPEMDALRGKKTVAVKNRNVGSKPASFNLPADNDGICEIVLNLDAPASESVNIVLANKAGEQVKMVFNPKAHTLSFDRTQSGLSDFSKDFPAVVESPTFRNSTVQKLRIFVDRSSIEVFDTEGNFVITNLVFPTMPYSTLSLSSVGGKARVDSLEIFSINLSK